MTIARNLALDGNRGVTPGHFDRVSSSPSALCALTRVESLFLNGPLALAALLRRRPGTACALITGAAAALAGPMAFAAPQGGH